MCCSTIAIYLFKIGFEKTEFCVVGSVSKCYFFLVGDSLPDFGQT